MRGADAKPPGDAIAAHGEILVKILIVGGTNFIGPHVVELALDRGHEPVLFNRGKTDPERFAHLEQLRGDRREGDYEALAGRKFDAVVDMSAYFPRAVRELRKMVGDAVPYVFVSTISVFADFSEPGLDEDSPVATADEPAREDVTPENYGALKALCEDEARKFASAAIVRPGLVVGPGDPTDRFTYWVAKMCAAMPMVAPPAEDRIQFIDVRDLAAFLLDAAEKRLASTFNAVAPPGFATVGELLEVARRVTECEPDVWHVPPRTLESFGLKPWVDVPAWAPSFGPTAGLAQVSSERAQQAGLKTRTLEDTVRSLWEWWRALDEDRRANLRAGMSFDREATVLAGLAARSNIAGSWDDKYAGEDFRFGTRPNAFLESVAPRITAGGSVLCVGDGEGRNGVWLAEHGFEVTSVEPSRVALEKMRSLASKRGVDVRAIQGTLPLEELPDDAYDAVVLIFVHMIPEVRVPVHAQVRKLVKPGGLVILEAYTPEQLTSDARGGPPSEDLMYRKQQLESDFADFELELVEETWTDLDEGPSHQGHSPVVRLIARRPPRKDPQ